MSIKVANATAPVNIATLKYWGKRDSKLNLPTNSSISITLDQQDLRTLTSAAASETFQKDRFWLNGEENKINARMQNCLDDLRELRKKLEFSDSKLPRLSEWKLHIVSANNFPTAAGLASSAAGLAALVSTIALLFELKVDNIELSKIARKGSGSACRSLFGGYVAWEMGDKFDGSDSKAVQIETEDNWPDMKALILVVADTKKDVPSTSGMQLTVKTSDLFQERIKNVVPKRFKEMKQAILNKDFEKFAELTMKDSNSFHATCLDSYPPIFYMNDTSKNIINLVHRINEYYNETIVAYTFDAGPNAVLYYLKQNEDKLFSIIYEIFKDVSGWLPKYNEQELTKYRSTFKNEIADNKLGINFKNFELYKGVSKVILTKIGSGPMPSKESLIDSKTGLPN